MSQCSWLMSMPKVPIAPSATVPVISCRYGAIASSVLPSLSSFSASAGMPRISPTAQVRAQSSTCTSGAGEVSRLQTIASTARPALMVATSRIGTRPSMTPLMSRRRQNEAMTGRAPSILICCPIARA